METSPLIFGCKGLSLTEEERAFYYDVRPLGFILFARNCETPAQIKTLVEEFKEATENEDALILIDQEGGRVARLKPPLWPEFPPASLFRNMAESDGIEIAEKAVYKNYREIGNILAELDINMNCAPVLDILFEGAHEIVGDRAFGKTPEVVARLGRKACEGLMDSGVTPVIKHIPGHGRANVDSHEKLPIVDTPLDVLEATDFAPFKALSDMPFAMTAHIIYKALDAENVATLSPTVISYMREKLGFSWNIMSDDVSMKALSGDLGDIATKALAAGCDIVLHCNGDMAEMRKIADAVGAYA